MTELMVELIWVLMGSGDDFMGSFDPMPESDVVQDVPVENGDDGIDMGIDDGTDGGIDMGIDGSGDDFMGSFDPMPESDVVQDVPVENGDLNGGINMVDENEDFMGADDSGLNIEDNIDDPIGLRWID